MDIKARELVNELSIRFQINNGFYLAKALVLLKQFQTGSAFEKQKKIQAKDILGVNAKEISIILRLLRDSFGIQVIQRVNMNNVPTSTSATVGQDFTYENTNCLETAISILEFISAARDKRLTLHNGEFYYRDKLFELRKNSNLYLLLKSVFRLTLGQSGIIEYKNLVSDLKVNSGLGHKNPKQLKQLIHRNLTVKGRELMEKISTQFQESEPLFKTVDKIGVEFLNES